MAKKDGWQRGLGKYAKPMKITEGKVDSGTKSIARPTYADNHRGSHEIRGTKR